MLFTLQPGFLQPGLQSLSRFLLMVCLHNYFPCQDARFCRAESISGEIVMFKILLTNKKAAPTVVGAAKCVV
jgi:hypothetical protein